MAIDNTANTPDRIRRALAGADAELYRLGATRTRRYVISAADVQQGEQTSQRIILDILPPGTQLTGQFIAIETPFDSTDGQAVTATGQRTFAPAGGASTWTNATSAASIGPSVAAGTTVGSNEGFVCWGGPIAYAINIAAADLNKLTKGRICVTIVLAPLRAVADDTDYDRSRFGSATDDPDPSVLITGAGGGGGPIALDDLTDVTIAGLSSGDVLTWDGAGWVNLPPGGVTPITGISVEIDFGTDDTYVSRVITGQTWVTSSMVFSAMVAGDVKSDHDPEDGLLEGLIFTVSDVIPGTGFTIHAYAPNGTFGKFNVNVSSSNSSGSVVTI